MKNKVSKTNSTNNKNQSGMDAFTAITGLSMGEMLTNARNSKKDLTVKVYSSGTEMELTYDPDVQGKEEIHMRLRQ